MRMIKSSDDAVTYLKDNGFPIWWAGLDRTGASYWALSISAGMPEEFKLYRSPEIVDFANLHHLRGGNTNDRPWGRPIPRKYITRPKVPRDDRECELCHRVTTTALIALGEDSSWLCYPCTQRETQGE